MAASVRFASKVLGRPLVDTRDVLNSCYTHLLHRDPDAAGFAGYSGFLRDGGSIDHVIKDIVDSDEFKNIQLERQQRLVADADQDLASSTDITMIQTCDGPNYYPLLLEGRQANEAYALRNGFKYECFLGIKRGYFPWHACFNRIIMLQDMVRSGYRGWAFYLDADAYVFDQAFDLAEYLDRHSDKAFIAGAGGSTGEHWDINDGAFLVNLGHPDAREIVQRWHDHFLGTPDDALRCAVNWEDVPSDQPRLHEILRETPRLMEGLLVEVRALFNDYRSSFVRQALRGHGLSIAQRAEIIRRDLADSVKAVQPTGELVAQNG
jgi:hypothetical protein